jgi:hypothetical protein
MHDILEKCLVELEQGADVDTVLFRYPEFADELRPILEASIKAMDMAVSAPPIAMVQSNRAELLRRAAQMRQAKEKRTSRVWFASMRRLAVTFIVLVGLFASGNQLVHASSTTIPGDNLYPVKRTWEDLVVLFAFNPQHREEIEFEHDNERLDELTELFAEGRSVKVDFAGYVTPLSATDWQVSGIKVRISPQTVLPIQPVTAGMAVHIIGQTQSDSTVLAERVEILPSNIRLPEIEDDHSGGEQEQINGETESQEGGSNSGSGGETDSPNVTETAKPESESGSSGESESNSGITATPRSNFEIRSVSFDGKIESMVGNTWVIGGRSVNVSSADISGKAVIGATANVEGYYDASGGFIVKKIDIESSSSSTSGSNDGLHIEGSDD